MKVDSAKEMTKSFESFQKQIEQYHQTYLEMFQTFVTGFTQAEQDEMNCVIDGEYVNTAWCILADITDEERESGNLVVKKLVSLCEKIVGVN